jgi:hypothetical protein
MSAKNTKVERAAGRPVAAAMMGDSQNFECIEEGEEDEDSASNGSHKGDSNPRNCLAKFDFDPQASTNCGSSVSPAETQKRPSKESSWTESYRAGSKERTGSKDRTGSKERANFRSGPKDGVAAVEEEKDSLKEGTLMDLGAKRSRSKSPDGTSTAQQPLWFQKKPWAEESEDAPKRKASKPQEEGRGESKERASNPSRRQSKDVSGAGRMEDVKPDSRRSSKSPEPPHEQGQEVPWFLKPSTAYRSKSPSNDKESRSPSKEETTENRQLGKRTSGVGSSRKGSKDSTGSADLRAVDKPSRSNACFATAFMSDGSRG